MFVCVLPAEADIVRGFEKVAGGSGLLSMIVPEIQNHLHLILPEELNNDYLPITDGEQLNTLSCLISTVSDILNLLMVN